MALFVMLITLAQSTVAQPRVPMQRPPSKVVVQLRTEPTVHGTVFTLGEIARVTGSDRALVERVSAVEVGTSPLPGLTRLLFLGDVITRLRYNGINPNSVVLESPPSIRIVREAARVDNTAIVQAATQQVEAANSGDGELVVQASPPTTQLYVSPGVLTYQAGAPQGELGGGSVIVPVSILVDGKPAKSVDVLLKVHRKFAALVAARPLAAHDTIGAADVTTETVEAPLGGPSFLRDVNSVIGKRTTKQIPMGAPLREGDVEAVPVVVPGARVNVLITAGGFTIIAPAVARTQGAVGDRVRVFVKTTHKELSGTVVDAGTVRVEEVP